MQIFKSLEEWQRFRHQLPVTIELGFVPTMGNLHAGHASLYKTSMQSNDRTLASVFINPTQFNRRDDFSNYPRTLDDDLSLLTQLGVDYCLLPDEQSIYPDDYCYQVQENRQSLLMEGKHRPGHFNGVLSVVMKLLNLAKPHRAYFGEKDYQQFLLIRDMVNSFFMNIEVIPCPTVRETSGLAYSSRNNRLNKEQRQRADQFAHIFHSELSTSQMIGKLNEIGIIVEYIEEHEKRRFAAVKIDEIRLIDNYLIP